MVVQLVKILSRYDIDKLDYMQQFFKRWSKKEFMGF